MVTLSNGSDDIVNMPLNLFVATPEIRFKNIVPYNLVFSNDIGQVIDNFELYKKIFDAVLEYGYEALRKTTPENRTERRTKISKCLFGEANMIRNDSIIGTALELMNKYDREQKLPHLAIVGQASSGKTTLAKNLAKLSGSTAGDIESVINLAFVSYHQFCDLLSEKKKGSDNIYISEDSFADYPFIEIGEDINIKFNDDANGIGNTALRIFYMIVMEEIEKKCIGDINKRFKEEKFSIEKNGSNCSSVAVHEVGHAIVSKLLGLKTFDSITIITRGNALGYVMPANQTIVTKGEYITKIKSCMGGRLAEEIVFGKDDISHGAVQDMRQATYLARNMVEQYGFSDEFGFMTQSVPKGSYLGGESVYTCSEQFREKIDIEISNLLKNFTAKRSVYSRIRERLSSSLPRPYSTKRP